MQLSHTDDDTHVYYTVCVTRVKHTSMCIDHPLTSGRASAATSRIRTRTRAVDTPMHFKALYGRGSVVYYFFNYVFFDVEFNNKCV